MTPSENVETWQEIQFEKRKRRMADQVQSHYLTESAIEAIDQCDTLRQLSARGHETIIARRAGLLTADDVARIAEAAESRREWIDAEAARRKAEWEKSNG